MNFRFLLLFAALGLSACNGSDFSDSSTTTTSTFDAETAVAQAKLDGLNAEIGQKTAALTAAGTKLTQTEQAEAALNTKTRAAEEKLAGVLAEADAKTKEVETAGTTLKDRRDELADLEGPNGRIETLNREIAGLEKTRDGLAGVKGGDPGEIATLKIEREGLEERLVELKGVEGDQTKPGLIKLADDELKARNDELADLIRIDLEKPGKIKLAMDALAKYEGKDGLIEKAKAELVRLDGLKNDALEDTKTAKLEAARIRSDGLIETGRFAEAANILDTAGLTAEGASIRAVEAFVKDGKTIEAAGELKKVAPVKSVAALFTRAGMDEEAYKLYAPADHVLNDPVKYRSGASASLALKDVNEQRSVKRQSIKLNGKTIWFTASAGHLIAYAPKDPKNPDKKDAQASIFYTAYTRDDLPKNKRPITFFFNGGPGSASIWLHMGAWAPKYLKTDAPNLPAQQPSEMPLIDNDITLLDQTDLVFVDPVDTGYSQAIAPHKNSDYQSVMPDIYMTRDLITSYTNLFNRQSSPKFLYGESYSGIRVPKAAALLLKAGTTQFVPDPSGFNPVALSGIILNSPIMDYGSNCDKNTSASCAGFIPAYAFTADFHGKSLARGQSGFIAFDKKMAKFAGETYQPGFLSIALRDDVLLNQLWTLTGVASLTWKADYNMQPADFKTTLMPDWSLGRYDARMKLPKSSSYLPDDFADVAFPAALKTHLSTNVNFNAKVDYFVSGRTWNRDNWASTTDLIEARGMEPSFKVLIVHGYTDTATPYHQSELDLQAVGLEKDVPVKTFEGGHMIYFTQTSRAPLKTTLDEYYLGLPYSYDPAPVVTTQNVR